ncbi:hypothetical protein P5808_28640 [Bacillus cereus]|uniref:hypothetical protein n=1 Tax=Bacillus cereus TaxID=1396 RepID=UPI002406D941|nr:hypothetical protein [Bacillus cereus]MDF9505893.1 hypothetical protein [Bacillus cereus]MDF9597883.1 hypothetical protein [Bacillus cereus]MDF9610020.1 hypothetical protein [Bacillus cereus]MDF9661040.1 hypothetical protein [Bacillus cereus]
MAIFWKVIYIVFKGITTAILSALLIYFLDIAKFLPFVPSERTFVISNAIYVAFIVGVFTIIEDLYENHCLKYDMFFSPDTDKRNEKETPTIIINEDTKFARFYLDISITGIEKKLKKNKIIIHFPKALTLQTDVKQLGFVSINSTTRICEIDISELINEKSKQITTTNSKIKLTVTPNENFTGTDKTLNVDIQCKNPFVKWFFIKKKSNQLKLKLKG